MAFDVPVKRALALVLVFCMGFALIGNGIAAADPTPKSEVNPLATEAPAEVTPNSALCEAGEEGGVTAASESSVGEIPAVEPSTPGSDEEDEETEPSKPAEEENDAPPAEKEFGRLSGLFSASTASGVGVTVSVPDGAFEEAVEISVCDVLLDAVTESLVLSAAGGDRVLAAVDITFSNKNGEPVEPSATLTVFISAPSLPQYESAEIVHVDTLETGAVDFGSIPQSLGSSTMGGNTLVVRTDDFSIFAVVVSDGDESPALLHYSFFDAEENLLSEQIVKEGDTLYEPSVPKTLESRAFIGWFEKDGDTPFTAFGPVGAVEQAASVNLYARYSNETVRVIYYDTKGNVARSDTVPVDSKATVVPDSPIIPVDSLTQCHYGWATSPGGADVSGELSVGTEDVKLYPIVLEGWWVNFESNGGTAVNSQFIESLSTGDALKAREPAEPYREGYTFAGWFADSQCSDPYDFDTPVTATKTIFAGWTPNDNTVYKVIYWIEYQSDAENDIWDYKIIARVVNQSTTGAQTEYDPELIFNSTYRKQTYGYVLNTEKSETKTVAADGTTVVNVYFDCQTRNISVTFPDREGNNVTVSAENVKFTANMQFFWDMIAEHNDIDYLLDGHHEFLFQPNAVSVDTVDDLKSLVFYEDEHGYWRWVNYNLADRIFYETLEGVAPEGKEAVPNTSARILGGYNTDDRLYYEVSRGYVYGGTAKGIVPGSPTGFKCFFKGSDGNYGYSTSGVRTIWYHNTYGYGLDGSRDVDKRYEYNNDPDGFMDIYFYRLQFDLIFHENGGEELEDQKVYYEKNISVFDPAVIDPVHYTPGVSTRMNPDGQVLTFAGWYSDFTLSDPFDSFDLKMPAYNIDLFAKWAPITYTVTFDSNGGSEVPAVEGVEYSQRIMKPSDPTYPGYNFLGWTLDGSIFSFESGITKDITLVAQWNSVDTYPVVYDLNGASGTEPSDKDLYFAGANAPVLPLPSDVTAPDGKVFLGWLADSDGHVYYPNGSVTMPAAVLTLTAQWGEIDRPIDFTYDFNYAAFDISSYRTSETEHTFEGLLNNSEISASDFSDFGQTPDGYTFAGWNLASDGSGKTIMPGDLLWADREEPLPNRIYAIWEKMQDILQLMQKISIIGKE